MISTATKRVTFEEFEQMPEQPGKQELLDGELIELPPAKLRHNEIAERMRDYLKAQVGDAHSRSQALTLGKVHHEMGYRLQSHGWSVPDVSITHADQKSQDYYVGSPALAIEVISNEKTADYIDKKIKLYLENGAAEVWVLYPNQQHMWVYKSGGVGEVYSGLFRSELLAGQTIDLAEMLK
jgi:Uma2 family endonuclease